MIRRLAGRARARLTYANVMATTAVFIALGGTSYAALTLPRNSVGSTQIRSRAVGSSELKSRAVTSSKIRPGAVTASKFSSGARAALRGPLGPAGSQGPAGPTGITYRAAVNSGGGPVLGTARDGAHNGGTNEYRVFFDRDLSACVYSATLAAVQNGPAFEQPPAGRITVASGGGDQVLVKTFAADGSPVEAPFHLIVAC
jgi:hypothetical protein